MKHGPETKLDKRKKHVMSSWEIVLSLSFSQVMTNLEQSGSQILHEWSVKHLFLLLVTCYLTKTENRTKKISNTALRLLL